METRKRIGRKKLFSATRAAHCIIESASLSRSDRQKPQADASEFNTYIMFLQLCRNCWAQQQPSTLDLFRDDAQTRDTVQ
jgi:hypothetical protein